MKAYPSARLSRRYFLLVAGSAVVFASCNRPQENAAAPPSGSGGASLRVGVNPVPHGEILKFVKDNLASAAALDIEIIEFSDYVQPNLALKDNQLDANYFQHVPYMEDFGKERGIDMVFVAAVHIEPLGLYSKKVKSLNEVADGGTVAVPNDATNLGRSLKLLEANNLIKLKSGADVGATKADVEQNPKNLKLVELEAAQLPRSLDDTELSVINGNYAIEIGLTPSKDALALESAQSNPYANGLVVLRGRETDPNVVKLGELLRSPEVKRFIEDKYQGSVIPVA